MAEVNNAYRTDGHAEQFGRQADSTTPFQHFYLALFSNPELSANVQRSSNAGIPEEFGHPSITTQSTESLNFTKQLSAEIEQLVIDLAVLARAVETRLHNQNPSDLTQSGSINQRTASDTAPIQNAFPNNSSNPPGNDSNPAIIPTDGKAPGPDTAIPQSHIESLPASIDITKQGLSSTEVGQISKMGLTDVGAHMPSVGQPVPDNAQPTVIVRNIDEFNSAMKNVKAGDVVQLANGFSTDQTMIVPPNAQGIRIQAESQGGAVIDGHENINRGISIEAPNVTVAGITVQNIANGVNPDQAAISTSAGSKLEYMTVKNTDGVGANLASNSSLSNSYFQDCKASALRACGNQDYIDGVNISDNTFVHNGPPVVSANEIPKGWHNADGSLNQYVHNNGDGTYTLANDWDPADVIKTTKTKDLTFSNNLDVGGYGRAFWADVADQNINVNHNAFIDTGNKSEKGIWPLPSSFEIGSSGLSFQDNFVKMANPGDQAVTVAETDGVHLDNNYFAGNSGIEVRRLPNRGTQVNTLYLHGNQNADGEVGYSNPAVQVIDA